MVLVCVAVQGVNSQFFSERKKSGLCVHQKHICVQQTNSYVVCRCLVRARIAFHKSKRSAFDKTMIWDRWCLSDMRKCVCGEHINTCVWFPFSWIANTLRPQWSERHLHFAQSKPIDVYKHLRSSKQMLLPLQDWIATVYETASGFVIREFFLTIF